ncbi:MAG TPA: metal ABC transporter permease [Deltaproteobacteria bacterium]|nr:MAG: metal ABC transporter permease [Deltaproteobacteria bacterium GWA2_55_82]OGQ63222.1 MAG: metal ABC transporter permease [Deltaproteobacteria bacterium RIFCSPLOWO2_02_FULL_55_12]OIJ73057.1 MAG: metal ABC transporter permease [Deltaproteobacteria bacterium GWC2_55_46]HBG47818.1 metal ABC transporter permease [Deltaproteobacteria bacterium]HCY11919.1 metal ABC transporter permease [Deltaproteobacteria bacterium]
MPEIFELDFMRRAFAAGILISVILPLIGVFLVVRRYSLMADTLAHVSLVGVAIGVLTNTQPVVSAIAASTLAAVAIERLRGIKSLFAESILAIFLSGSLAVAVVIISLARGFNVDLLSYLFGSISTIGPVDLYMLSAVFVAVLLAITLLYKEFFLVSFDEEFAEAGGVNARKLNLLIVVLAAVTISLSMRIVGILLIGALMVIPVVSARQFDLSFRKTIFISIAFSLSSVISGLFLSYYLDLASGGTIVLIALAFFLLSFILNRPE